MGWKDAPEVAAPAGRWASAPEVDEPGMLATLGAGLGKGFGQVVLNAQKYAGKGIEALGGVGSSPTLSDLIVPGSGGNLVQRAGRWLQSDADSGLKKISGELQPYKDANPVTAAVGEFGGQVAATLPVGGVLANALGKVPGVASAAPNVLQSIRTAGMSAGGATGVANPLVRALGGAINGGATAALIDPESAATGATVGAILPGALQLAGGAGRAIGNAVRGGGASPEVVNLANRAEQLGIQVPADRLVDSKPLNRVAAALNYVPFSGRAASEKKMGEQLNAALTKTFGQDTSNVMAGLRQAETQLGGQFDQFLKSNTVSVDQQFLTDLADAVNRASRELGNDQASIIAKQVDDIVAKAGTGQIDGQAAYNIKKTLDRIGNRNSPEAWYALDLKGKLMDALNRSVGPQQAQAFAGLRQQYGNMLEIQKLAKNGADGDISVARLANLKDIRSPELQDLADIAAQFVKGRESSHGAAQLASFGLGGLAGYAGPGAFAGTVAAGRGANAALNSNALRNFVLQQPGQANALSRLVGPQVRQVGYRAVPALVADQ